MEFVLPFDIPPSPSKISLKQSVLFAGSCFASEIGQRMKQQRFDVCLNPYGILYNSESLCGMLMRIAEGREYQTDNLTEHNGQWFSLDHHGSFKADSADKCLNLINTALRGAHEKLKQASWLCVTPGSSWVYRLVQNGRTVGNCHKLPSRLFEKQLLPASDQIQGWEQCIEQLHQFNPSLQWIFSISPVRYIRDGLAENNVSKAQLFTTINHLVYTHEQVHYFPAYELVTDVLRDYRFFKEDMVHPNDLAIQYVWEKFKACYFGSREQGLHRQIEDYTRLSGHIVMDASSAGRHQQQLEQRNEAIEAALQALRQHALNV